MERSMIPPRGGIFDILGYGDIQELCGTEKTPLGGHGVLFVCIKGGHMNVLGTEYEKKLMSGECGVFVLGHGYTAFGKESEGRYVIADGSLVYDLMRFYGTGDMFSVYSPDAFEAMDDICRWADNKPSASELDGVSDTAITFHRLVYKLRYAAQIGAVSEGLASDIKKYIDTHLEGKLNLEQMSKLFFVSKTQIFRRFKAVYGVTPMQYCLQKKIELSRKMLEDGHMKVSEIADALSFTDAKHFTKTFKRITGELPKDYRKKPKQKS